MDFIEDLDDFHPFLSNIWSDEFCTFSCTHTVSAGAPLPVIPMLPVTHRLPAAHPLPDASLLLAAHPVPATSPLPATPPLPPTPINWNSLRAELEETIGKVKALDEIFQCPRSKQDVLHAINQTISIYAWRMEIKEMVDKVPSSKEKRETLPLLWKLKHLDEGGFIGKAVAVYNPDNAHNGKMRAVEGYNKRKASDLKTRKAEARKIFKAFHLTCRRMAYNSGQASGDQSLSQGVKSSSTSSQ